MKTDSRTFSERTKWWSSFSIRVSALFVCSSNLFNSEFNCVILLVNARNSLRIDVLESLLFGDIDAVVLVPWSASKEPLSSSSNRWAPAIFSSSASFSSSSRIPVLLQMNDILVWLVIHIKRNGKKIDWLIYFDHQEK